MFLNTYEGKKVLVIGHSGFKGSWLCSWLTQLGATVYGFSFDIPTQPSNFEVLGLRERISDIHGDIRDRKQLLNIMQDIKPEIVFHLAAQALVRKSYENAVETFETNALGTLNVLESIRTCTSVQAGVIITSDKCYRNVEWPWGYRETDTLGGEDPYSMSKGCAELIIYSYIQSFLHNNPRIASARAGNVIGGGDWAQDRIVPDAVRCWSQGKPVVVRNPYATRPWQHVLEPLSGYLWLGAKLWHKDPKAIGEAFNFGPDAKINQTVEELLSTMAKHWQGVEWQVEKTENSSQKESKLLKLCCDKALNALRWRAILSFEDTVAMTTAWYNTYYISGGNVMAGLTSRQIQEYTEKAKAERLLWTL